MTLNSATAEKNVSKPRIVVTRKWPEEVEQKLMETFDAVLNDDDQPMSAAELRQALQTADALCPTVSDSINAEVLSVDSKRATILASYGVGFNHIDIDAAKASGLVVTNGRQGTRVARLTLSQLLDAFRVVAELEALHGFQDPLARFAELLVGAR